MRVPIKRQAGLAPATAGHRGRVSNMRLAASVGRGYAIEGEGQIVSTATKVVLKPLEDRIVVQPLEAEQTTASGLVIGGDNEGNVMAFDGRTGKNVWHYQTGYPIWGGAPMTYLLDGRQYLVVGSGSTITAFALPSS